MAKKSISSIVEKVLSSYPCIEKALDYDVISTTRLAKKIREEVEISYGSSVSLSSVIMALERLKENKEKIVRKDYVIDSISSLSSIEIAVFSRTKEIDEYLSKIYKRFSKKVFLNVIEGNSVVSLISNKETMKSILSLINQKPLKIISELSMITIIFPETMLNTPGFISYILKEFSFENINIVEILSSYNELSIMVNKKDFVRAYVCIESLFK